MITCSFLASHNYKKKFDQANRENAHKNLLQAKVLLFIDELTASDGGKQSFDSNTSTIILSIPAQNTKILNVHV